MEINIDQTKWWQRIWAALIFFTRLPFWRLYQPPQACYKTVVEHWPLTGWLTGGAMAAIIYFGSDILPYSITLLPCMKTDCVISSTDSEEEGKTVSASWPS